LSDPHNLHRFLDAQQGVYEQALRELKAGQKRSHWIWFIFPQMKGLGMSLTSRKYSIQSLDEAKSYLVDPVLGWRLIECTQAVLDNQGRTADQIFGGLDAMKFRSSMTLFAHISEPGSIFHEALEKYFDGVSDRRTLELL